jgi:hypothetical protein
VVGEVVLRWTDASTNERGFRVIRDDVVIATLDADATTYTDPSPDEAHSCYAVEAFNSFGGARSNQACAQ